MKVKAVVLIADGEPDAHGDRILKKNVQLPDSGECNVTENFGPIIGKCKLSWEDDHHLVAEMDLPEINLEGKFPSVGGTLHPNAHPLSTRWEIDSVGIGESNADKRIKPFFKNAYETKARPMKLKLTLDDHVVFEHEIKTYQEKGVWWCENLNTGDEVDGIDEAKAIIEMARLIKDMDTSNIITYCAKQKGLIMKQQPKHDGEFCADDCPLSQEWQGNRLCELPEARINGESWPLGKKDERGRRYRNIFCFRRVKKMALADYRLCDKCGAKVFYDAHVDYMEKTKIGALCEECSGDHEIVIVSKGRLKEMMDGSGAACIESEINIIEQEE
jgi:hypothetical protein